MSTRCFIAMTKDNTNFQSIYCHHDGYDSVNKVFDQRCGNITIVNPTPKA